MMRIQTFVMTPVRAARPGAGQAAAQDVMDIYDALGSMWGQVDVANQAVPGRSPITAEQKGAIP
jgi:hypothetical protein